MKITREQLRNIVGEVLQEEKDYQSFFKAMLKKHGVSSPDEFKSDEEKKAFFNKVEDTWKGVSERLVQLKEDELTAKQQKIDLNKNGKVDGDDLSKLRAGAKTEGEEQLPQTKILSKEGETLVKSGAGNMYNISKVNESKESDINAKIDKLLSDAEAGKIKTFDEFLDKFYPLQKQLKSLRKESVNEAFPTKKVDAKVIADRMRNHKETKGFADKIEKLKMVSAEDLDKMLPDYVDGGVITKIFKESVNEASLSWAWIDRYANAISNLTQIDTKDVKKFIEDNKLNIEKIFAIAHKTSQGKTDFIKAIKAAPNSSIQNAYVKNYANESVNEGRYDADLDKIEAAVKTATSFMNVGSELKKAGIKYDFTTSMIPMYMIKVSGNTIAICNKKYAAGAEREVKDIAIGLLN